LTRATRVNQINDTKMMHIDGCEHDYLLRGTPLSRVLQWFLALCGKR